MMTFVMTVIALGLALVLLGLWVQQWMAAAQRVSDADVYRDQLRALDKERARGIVTDAEYAALRAEIARRLLAAGDNPATTAPGRMPMIVAATVGVGLLGALAIYPYVGVPGYTDMPMQARLDQALENRANLPAQADLAANRPELAVPDLPAEFEAEVARLRDALATRPDDLTGLGLLVRSESRLGNFASAHAAQKRYLGVRGDMVTAADWGLYSELLIIAAGDVISAEAEVAMREAFRLNPASPLVRYRLGQLNIQTGRPDLTMRIWDELLREGPETAPYVAVIRELIDGVAKAAGVNNYEQPLPRGPQLADIEAAQDLSDADRDAMIGAMVAGLSDRLASEGGPAEDWAQLIRAYGVLGQPDQAAAIYEEARNVFAGRPADLRLLDAAYDSVGAAQ